MRNLLTTFRTNKKVRMMSWVILVLVVMVYPFALKQYYVHLAINAMIFSILALSLNLVRGYTGLFSLAHAAFFGIGSYTAALVALHFDPPFPVVVLSAGLMASLAGALIAIPTLRLRGDYFAIATVGFGQMIRLTELNWMSLTHGPMGLPGIPSFHIFGYSFDQRAYYFFSFVCVLATVWFVSRVVPSRFGRAITSIREDEVAAEAMGVDTTRYKRSVLAVSMFFAGVAGSILATYLTFVSSDAFQTTDSAMILCMVVLGGVGTKAGPIIGALILIALPELLRVAAIYRLVMVGLVMVLAVLIKEGNLLGRIARVFRKRPHTTGGSMSARGG